MEYKIYKGVFDDEDTRYLFFSEGIEEKDICNEVDSYCKLMKLRKSGEITKCELFGCVGYLIRCIK